MENISTMRKHMNLNIFIGIGVLALSGGILNMSEAYAQQNAVKSPTLIITNQSVPSSIKDVAYSYPHKAPEVKKEQIAGTDYFQPTETVVGKKIEDLRKELHSLQADAGVLSEKLASLEQVGREQAAAYYADVGTISTQLQSGTTPGNPRLVQRMAQAQNGLEALAANVADLNELAVEISNVASMSAYLLESARATYGLTGAVEEDHARLALLEDSINNTIVVIERLQNNVSDNITRTSAYLASERSNLRAMSLAIANGDLYGKSLSNRPFSSVKPSTSYVRSSDDDNNTPLDLKEPVRKAPEEPKQLVKIDFYKPNVHFEQPVYMAVSKALERYPDARFDLVAVQPAIGNAAQLAIEGTRARRNAEKVLRSLTQMGLPLDRIDLSYIQKDDVKNNEVHLFVR